MNDNSLAPNRPLALFLLALALLQLAYRTPLNLIIFVICFVLALCFFLDLRKAPRRL